MEESAKEKKAKDPLFEARRIFDTFDKDHSGAINFAELRQAMKSMG